METFAGRNFFLILHDARHELADVSALLGCPGGYQPRPMEKWQVQGYREVLLPDRLQTLSQALEQGKSVVFFEQIGLLARRGAPSARPFLVYCDFRGIISTHATEDAARTALRAYYSRFGAGTLPFANIYHWTNGNWARAAYVL